MENNSIRKDDIAQAGVKRSRGKFYFILMVTAMITSTNALISFGASSGGADYFPQAQNRFRAVAEILGSAPAEVGGKYEKIIAASVSDSGDIAFSASLIDSAVNNAILLNTDNVTRVILRAGEDAPEGGRYKAFSDVDITSLQIEGKNENVLIFRAALEGGSAQEGIFLWKSRAAEVFALSGQQSPRGNVYESFSSPTIAALSSDSSEYKMVFIAAMQGGKKSAIIKASYNDAVEILATGDQIGPNPEVVEDFTISRMGFSVGCVVRAHLPKKKKKHFKKSVILHDGFIVSGDVLKDGVKFPTLGKVDDMLDNPAVNFQSSFTSIIFKNGNSALAMRDVDGNAEIFAKTGDAAPGLPSETVQSFGSPLSNSGRGRFGVASVVRLSSGRPAVWIAGFTHKVPFEAENRSLLLIGGDISGDQQEITFRSFSIIKLTNNGTLLLRGVVDRGGENVEVLFTVDGLFSGLQSL